MLLKKLVEDSGVGNWAEKSLWFPGRTDANLMARWKTGCMSGKDIDCFLDLMLSFLQVQ
jgi:hypothetical protein